VHDISMDEALRRGEAMKQAGADILFVLARKPEDARHIAERLPPPLMYMFLGNRAAGDAIPVSELHRMGYRLFVEPVMPLLAMHRALRDSYQALRDGRPDPLIGTEAAAEQHRLHDTIGLETLLEIERRTVER